MDLTEKLWAIEEIKQLKARYFRTMDNKDWKGLSEIFCDDAIFDARAAFKLDAEDTSGKPTPGDAWLVSGGAAILDFIRTGLGASVSVHQGFCHEIEILSPTEARGVIAMEDRVGAPGMRDGAENLHGWGHYHETYRKVDGRWKIYRSKITRLRVETQGV